MIMSELLRFFNNFRITNEIIEHQTSLNEFRAMRYGCYRVIIASLLGHLGRGVRVRLPACVINAVRTRWPSCDGIYTGFKPDAIFDDE